MSEPIVLEAEAVHYYPEQYEEWQKVKLGTYIPQGSK